MRMSEINSRRSKRVRHPTGSNSRAGAMGKGAAQYELPRVYRSWSPSGAAGFITDASTHVVGIGLHTSLLESFKSQLANDVNNGLGLAELVDMKRPLAESGVPLGHEPLGFEATRFHSWLCHNTPKETHLRFGIRPNQFGLIDKFEDARQVNDYLLQTGAEPAIWEPWLLLDYAPKSTPLSL